MKFREMLSQCDVGDAVLLDVMVESPRNERFEDAENGAFEECPFLGGLGNARWWFIVRQIPIDGNGIGYGWVRTS